MVNNNITFVQPIILVIHYSDPNHAFKLMQGSKLQEPSKYPLGFALFRTWHIMSYLLLIALSIEELIISLRY